MASATLGLEDDLTCSVCCGIFNNPVLLSCSHSFCKDCLKTVWLKRNNRECPMCRRRSSKEMPPLNLALKHVCEFVQQGKQRQLSASDASASTCTLHTEKIKLFCLTDEEPVCVDCIGSGKHKGHNICAIKGLVQDRKEELITASKPLKEKLEELTKLKRSCDHTRTYMKNQAQKTEAQIKQEFEKLHQFLRDEEAARIAELRDEEEQKSNILEESVQKISRELESLSEVIQSLERDMKVADMSFLQGFKDTKMRILSTLDDSKDIYLPLIDTGKHLASLKYRVWEKMLGIVKYVPLTLEPLSAHPQLSLEDELTSVRYSFRGRHIPDNPERFNLYVYVLGSRGHTSGTHRWDVELGSKPNCRLGAARGSVRRKGNFTVCPQEGFFTVSLRNRELRAGTTPETRLALKRIPHRIRVVLDCDKGEVSFYDPIEMTPLFTFKNTGTEKMYPLFGISKDSAPLRICPVEVSVKPEY